MLSWYLKGLKQTSSMLLLFSLSVKCPSPMRNRDFVTQRSWYWEDDNFIIFNHTVHHKVRRTNGWTANLFRNMYHLIYFLFFVFVWFLFLLFFPHLYCDSRRPLNTYTLYRKTFIRILQETLIYIVCLSVELTSNNFPFFSEGLNFTTP